MSALSLARNVRKAQKQAKPVDEGRMSIVEHLIELRRRLTIALAAMLLGAILVAVVFYDPVLGFITHPFCSLPKSKVANVGPGCSLVFSSPADGFLVRIKVSMIAGFLFSSPVWLWQIWRFLAPGLYKKERRYALSFVLGSILLFAGGVTVAYLVLSKSLSTLIRFSGPHVVALLDIEKYLSFVTTIMLVFGTAFEIPLLIVMLNVAGVVHSSTLRKYRRIVIFLMFAFAAIATPTQDPFSMLALAIPLCLLFEGAILFSRFNDRRRDRGREHFEDLDDDAVSPLDTRIGTETGLQPVEAASPVLVSSTPQPSVIAPYNGSFDDDIT